MITNLNKYLNLNTQNNIKGAIKMNNYETLTQLEEKDHELGCVIDITLKNDLETLNYSLDTWDLLEYGIKSHCLNIEDYTEINTLDPNEFNRSDLIKPVRAWLKQETPEEYLNGYNWDETVKTGHITINGTKYQYIISISH